jgi:maleylacetoacetate isomerase
MKLYHYWRSTSSWRVRWALEFKKIPCELIPINLLNGEAETPEHLSRHPLGFVPVLELPTGETLIESLAIIQYLELKFPESPSLFPQDPIEKAKAIVLAEVINSGTHPLQNPTVTAYLGEHLQATADQQKAWSQHWIGKGLELYEKLLPESILNSDHPFSVSSGFSIADLCLLPQLYNAKRYEVNLEAFPKISAIQNHLMKLESYQNSHADRYQPITP